MPSPAGRRLDGHDLAVFRRPEHDLAGLEILVELVGSRLRNVAGLRRAERHIFDAALFVLEPVDGVEPRFRHLQRAGERVDDLPAQRHPALFGDEALLGVAGVAQKILEPRPVESAAGSPEHRIGGDAPHDLVVGNAEPHLPRALIEPGIHEHFAEHLPVEADLSRLFRRQRMADLMAEALQALVIDAPELVDRDFGAADLGERRAAEAAKDVVDAPDREARGKQAHDHAHHGAAEPISGGFADTSKHFGPGAGVRAGQAAQRGPRIIRSGALAGN